MGKLYFSEAGVGYVCHSITEKNFLRMLGLHLLKHVI